MKARYVGPDKLLQGAVKEVRKRASGLLLQFYHEGEWIYTIPGDWEIIDED